MKQIVKFLSLLFAARTQAHIYHLQTTSYAAHKALNSFYDDIVDLADTYAERAQGIVGLIEGYTSPDKFLEDDDPVAFFEKLRDQVEGMEKSLPDDCDLQNTFADITGLIHETIYKLRFLA